MQKIAIKPLTKEELEKLPKDVLVMLEPPFADDRGFIQPLVDMPMKSAVIITSKKGTVRANHYHQTDWHFCTVISGKIKYHWRDHGGSNRPESLVVEAGQTFFTPPMVEHAMEFLEDTTFLTLGRNSRKQEVYEADVVRVKLI